MKRSTARQEKSILYRKKQTKFWPDFAHPAKLVSYSLIREDSLIASVLMAAWAAGFLLGWHAIFSYLTWCDITYDSSLKCCAWEWASMACTACERQQTTLWGWINGQRSVLVGVREGWGRDRRRKWGGRSSFSLINKSWNYPVFMGWHFSLIPTLFSSPSMSGCEHTMLYSRRPKPSLSKVPYNYFLYGSAPLWLYDILWTSATYQMGFHDCNWRIKKYKMWCGMYHIPGTRALT